MPNHMSGRNTPVLMDAIRRVQALMVRARATPPRGLTRFALRVVSVFLCMSAAACASGGAAPERDVIAPAGTPAVAPYSPAIRTGNLVFLSGQIGIRPGTRALAAGGVAGETEQALENVRTVLTAAGLSPADVVKCTVFLADMRDYEAMNEVYARFFGAAPPARSAVGVNGLPLGARVEVECIAGTRT